MFLFVSFQYERPAIMDIGLYCQLLHQDNPYLKLGPMKYEMLNYDPEISLLHDFISDVEIKKIKTTVKGKLVTTPYLVDGKPMKFSKERLSKIKYLTEHRDNNIKKISQKIEMATKFTLFQNTYDSENYQVIMPFKRH